MNRSASGILQGQLMNLARQRSDVDSFSKHLQRLPRMYTLGHAISALEGLHWAGIPMSKDSAAHVPVKQGLNMLLWEQVIRKGRFTTEEKKRVRNMYIAHAHFSLQQDSAPWNKVYLTSKKLERMLNEALLDLADLDRFGHIHTTAKNVFEKVFKDVSERDTPDQKIINRALERDKPYRQVMNFALTAFNNLLSNMESIHENKEDLRQVIPRPAKPL